MLDINWGNLLKMLKKKPRSLLFDVSYLGLNFIACYRFLWGFFLGLGTNEWMMLMEIYVTCVDKEKTTTVGKCCFVTLISFWWHLAPLFWEFFSFKRTRKQGPKDHPWESIEEKEGQNSLDQTSLIAWTARKTRETEGTQIRLQSQDNDNPALQNTIEQITYPRISLVDLIRCCHGSSDIAHHVHCDHRIFLPFAAI